MKKCILIALCLSLTACDNNYKVVGKCKTDNFSIHQKTQNGQLVREEATLRLVCECFKKLPQLAPSKENFLFEFTENVNRENVEYKFTSETGVVSGNISQTQVEKICDKECTKLCNKK